MNRLTGRQPCRSLDDVHSRRGLLVRLAYRFCWNLDDAEDVVQSALATAATKQDQLTEKGKLWPWVKSIVVRECLDLTRRVSRHRKTLMAAEDRHRTDPPAKTPVDGAIQSELTELVTDLIAALPERQRSAIVLRHLEGMPYSGIADVLGISESTARVHVRNAREALRRGILKHHPEWALSE